jgi:hypothetical protein
MDTSQLLAAIDEEIRRFTEARALLAGLNGASSSKNKMSGVSKPAVAKRILSPEARKRIADAQRKRWAAQKKAAK